MPLLSYRHQHCLVRFRSPHISSLLDQMALVHFGEKHGCEVQGTRIPGTCKKRELCCSYEHGWQACSPTHTKQTQHLAVSLSPDCQRTAATKCTLLTCSLCPQWPLVRHRHCGCPFPRGLIMCSLILGGRYLTLMTLNILHISPMMGLFCVLVGGCTRE